VDGCRIPWDDRMVESSSRIVVSRPVNGIFAFRRLAVRLDGAIVARLPRGREAEVEVDLGKHTVQAGVDWSRSLPVTVEVEESDSITIEVSAPWSALWRSFVTPRRALSCQRTG
jgi:hypothetical protein